MENLWAYGEFLSALLEPLEVGQQLVIGPVVSWIPTLLASFFQTPALCVHDWHALSALQEGDWDKNFRS